MRKIREWYVGAIYHIMQRGIRRKEIFSHESDYFVFLTLLEKNLIKYKCILHSYCLMTNHYHILVETTGCEIWRFMKSLAQTYATYYNAHYHFSGHLFEGRYVSCLVKDDTYFLQTSRYIHLNPVKAKMVEYPEDYKWSSYKIMISKELTTFFDKSRTLNYFTDNKEHRYREFVEDNTHKYDENENIIMKNMKEDDLWLPW